MLYFECFFFARGSSQVKVELSLTFRSLLATHWKEALTEKLCKQKVNGKL